jgi:hypothetical protein
VIDRRKLLLSGLGIAGLAAVSVWGVGAATESHIVAAVRRRLPSLRFDQPGLQAFAKDYMHFAESYVHAVLDQRPTWVLWKFHARTLVQGPADHVGLVHETRSRSRRLEEYWATLFLLSSNFFVTGANESRVVRYLGLYDPMRACGNPFARPAFDSPVKIPIA